MILARLARPLVVVLLALAVAPAARAQRPEPVAIDTARRDSARVAGADTIVAPELRPPLSPRRAFVYSLLAPGTAQVILGRPSAAGLFVLAEAIALVMIRESGAELREARMLVTDSIVSTSDARGQPVLVPGPFPRELVRTRRAHLEDWIAFLVANHIFAGADAFVAAQLWDVPVRVGANATADRRFRLTASLRW